MSKTLLAMLGGAALGAGAALLLAPQTGRATRARIRDKAVKYSNDVTDFAQSKASHLRNKMTGYRHMAGDLAEKAQDLPQKAQDLRERGEDLMNRGHEIMDHGSQAMDKAKSSMGAAMDQEEELIPA